MSQTKGNTEDAGRRVWQAHINAWKKSGLSGAEYCRRRQVSYHAFVYWKKRLSDKRESVDLVPVPIILSGSGKRPTLQVDINGYSVDVPDGFCSETLGRLIGVLEQRR